MPNCPKCNGDYDEGAKFCPHCGATLNADTQSAQPNSYQQPNYQQPPQYNAGYQPPYGNSYPASGILSTGQLVWSILNIVFCCRILGIVALVMTILAKGAPSAPEEQSKLKTAKTLNLIGTIAGGIFVIIYMILVVTGTVAGIWYY